jgi:DNA-directed RNA polymerase subunit RPC12/RpoP
MTEGLAFESTLDGGGAETEWAAGQQTLREKAEALAADWDAHAKELREDYVASVGPAAAALVTGHREANMLAKHAADLRTLFEAGTTFAAVGSDGMTEYTCLSCGSGFRSNCDRGDIDCPDCEARLCSHCGEWDQQVGY